MKRKIFPDSKSQARSRNRGQRYLDRGSTSGVTWRRKKRCRESIHPSSPSRIFFILLLWVAVVVVVVNSNSRERERERTCPKQLPGRESLVPSSSDRRRCWRLLQRESGYRLSRGEGLSWSFFGTPIRFCCGGAFKRS